MIGRRHMSLVAAGATLLAAAPLSAIFQSWVWFLQCVIAVGMISGAAVVTRSARGPIWAQVAAMAGALLLILTWMFPSHHEFIGIIPAGGTFDHFGELLSGAVTDMREYGVPVPDRGPLLFVTVLGVGVVAIFVDLFSVGLRRPALAGLPMLAIYSVPVAVYTSSVPVIPFIIGAFGFLWLLAADNVDRVRRFGRRFTGDGRDVDVWEPSPLAAAGRRLAVVGVVLAVALPVAVPGMTTGLLERFGTVGGDGGGIGNGTGNGSGAVDLFAELSGQLNQDTITTLLKVTTDDPDPFYVRFGVADVVTQEGFRNRSQRGQRVDSALPPAAAPHSGVTQTQHHASVQVVGFNMPLLPVYTQPTSVKDLNGSWLYDATTNVVFSNRNRTKDDKSYSFDYITSDYSPQALRTATQLTPDNQIQQQFTQVPAVPAIQNKVKDLIAGQSTAYDKVLAIYDYFSAENGFKYSLQTRAGTSGSAIVDFLTSKTGFCEQYAAAMAWLVRTAGIPARVAFGFTRGSQRDGDAYVLTNRNLHAWTEVYFNGFGWVPFDATPASSVPGAVDPIWAPNTDNPSPTPSAGNPSTSAGPQSTAGPGANDPGAQEHATAGGGSTGGGIKPNSSNWAWWTLAFLVLIMAVLGIPALRRVALRRRRRAVRLPAGKAVSVAPADPDAAVSPMVVVADDAAEAARAAAHAAWDELMDTMLDYRLRVDDTETPRTTAERLITESVLAQPTTEGVRLLARAEERARYARSPIGDDGLATALKALRHALARRASRRTRLTATLMPPSVLQRWRLSLLDRSSASVTTLARWRAAVTPRRLLPRSSR